VDDGAPVSEQERETRYLAVDGAEFDQLIEQTRAMLSESSDDKRQLLTRWLSLQMAMTVVALAKGSTEDSQAQITALLKTIDSLQTMAGRMETEHIDWRGPDGEKMHPDWCRECRIDRIMYGVKRALEELERHIDQPGTPPDVSNVCRRVARYLTDPKGWHAPIEWESAGLREVRELVEQYVKLNSVDNRYPWVSTIDGVRTLLGDIRAMQKTIERRGRWLAEAKRRLAVATGQPLTNIALEGTGIQLVRGGMVTIDVDGKAERYRITDVQDTGPLSYSVDLERVD
jgi:hypothetical protein